MKITLNAEHIEAIHAAMQAGGGSPKKAAELLNWGPEWDAKRVKEAIYGNDALSSKWRRRKNKEAVPIEPPDAVQTSIYRPELEIKTSEPDELPESSDDQAMVLALKKQEKGFRDKLEAMGESPEGINFLVAARDLQNKHALCTLNAVTGGLLKTHSDLRKARDEAMAEIKALFSSLADIEDADPKTRALIKANLCEREECLRTFYIQCVNAELQLVDRTHKAFFLHMEAKRRAGEKKNDKPKNSLAMTAMPGSRVGVVMNAGQSSNGNAG